MASRHYIYLHGAGSFFVIYKKRKELDMEEIPISAQVVSLADVYDALVSERVYKKAFSHETAIEMIKNGECGIFNPILIECMLEIQDKMREAYHIK